MTSFMLITVMTIGLLQVCMCTANPVSSQDEIDPAKLYTADELTQAKNAGITEHKLVSWKSMGGTFAELIKVRAFERETTFKNLTFENMAKFCEILVPGYRITSSNYSRAQEADLRTLFQISDSMKWGNPLTFARTTLCDYVSDPHSPSFGPKFVPHMEIRSLKMRVETDPYLDRVNIAKRMCCIDEGGHLRGYEEDSGLRDEEMTKFENQWSHFDIANIPKSIKDLCDFLHSTNTFDDDRCQKKSRR